MAQRLGSPNRVRRLFFVGMWREKVRVLASYGVAQVVVLLASTLRIPAIVQVQGVASYGALLALTAIPPFVLLAYSGLTSQVRIIVAETSGHAESGSTIAHYLRVSLRKSRHFSAITFVAGVLASTFIPWHALVGAIEEPQELPWASFAMFTLCALSAPGAVYLGYLHGVGRIGLSWLFQGAAAGLSLGLIVLCSLIDSDFIWYVISATLGACGPLWFAWLTGMRTAPQLKQGQIDRRCDQLPQHGRGFIVMTGASAPPIFSSGLDPVVLGLALGPLSVAEYGIATRLGLLVTLVPSALYPLAWAAAGRRRGSAGSAEILRGVRRELLVFVGAATILGALYVGFAPYAAYWLTRGAASAPFGLYLTIAILGILASIQTVLLPILGGPRSAKALATVVYAAVLPNAALSFVLALYVGSAGPVLASIVYSVLLLLWIVYFVRRRPERLEM